MQYCGRSVLTSYRAELKLDLSSTLHVGLNGSKKKNSGRLQAYVTTFWYLALVSSLVLGETGCVCVGEGEIGCELKAVGGQGENFHSWSPKWNREKERTQYPILRLRRMNGPARKAEALVSFRMQPLPRFSKTFLELSPLGLR